MATQRVIPIEEDAVPALVITINQNFVPSSAGCFIAGSGEQPVTFVNNSGAACTITFDVNPISGTVFTSPINLPAPLNSSNTQTPPANLVGATVNYYISAPGVNNGPYAIQIGPGPMYIQFAVDVLGVKVNPTPVAIPPAGTLEMLPADTNTYNVTWANGVDPFTPPITTADSQVHTEDLSLAQYSYTVQVKTPGLGTGHGGGKVVVTGS